MKNRVGVYAGTFDPITNGHLDIITRALGLFDELYIAVAVNKSKNTAFSVDKRIEIVQTALVESKLENANIKIIKLEGLLVDFVKKIDATAIIRGLRAVSDYEYEAQMAQINRKLYESAETVFFVASDKYSYISSSIVKNIASNSGDVSSLVPKNVSNELKILYK